MYYLRKFFCLSCLLLLIDPLSFANKYSHHSSPANLKTVRSFYQAAFNDKNYAAADKYLGNHYIQHGRRVKEGHEGLQLFISMLNKHYPRAHIEIRRIFSDKNLVISVVHFVLEPNSRGLAIIDIMRLEHGKIVEHWGVSQEVTEHAANANPN